MSAMPAERDDAPQLDEPWPLPQGWALATLAELAGRDGVAVDGDWVESKDQDPNGNVRLVQLADIGEGIFQDKSRRFLTAETAEQLNCTFLAEGDVLIARWLRRLDEHAFFQSCHSRP